MIKVLFIEDDPDQVFLYKEVLALKDLPTVSAATLEQTLKIAETDKPDIILLDIMLRHENGLDIMERLKQGQATKNIPVIVFTNTNKKEYRDRAEKLGAADFVIKSQTIPQEMADRIKKIVEKDRLLNQK